MPGDFDVFLSHNSRDNPQVEDIGNRLRARGLRVWLDEWELRPGFPWQEGLEGAIQASRAVAVFVGAEGLGTWQEPEMRAFIARSRREKVPVIPVLLPGCPDSPQLNLLLEAYTWVDLRDGLSEEGLARLAWGITGAKPDGMLATATRDVPQKLFTFPRNLRVYWSCGIALSVLSVVLTTGAWHWLHQPEKPQMYEVRVQVLDPQGHPVDGSNIRASAGNEPHLLPDGWWEVQIPAAKVPSDGHVTLWAEHKEWEESSADLPLGAERNPKVTIHLTPPETWIRGTVVDGANNPLSGVRVTSQDGLAGVAITDAEGRFSLKLAVPRETQVRLRSTSAGWKTGDDFCYAGRDTCGIILEK
jgi:hypothetical protein